MSALRAILAKGAIFAQTSQPRECVHMYSILLYSKHPCTSLASKPLETTIRQLVYKMPIYTAFTHSEITHTILPYNKASLYVLADFERILQWYCKEGVRNGL